MYSGLPQIFQLVQQNSQTDFIQKISKQLQVSKKKKKNLLTLITCIGKLIYVLIQKLARCELLVKSGPVFLQIKELFLW